MNVIDIQIPAFLENGAPDISFSKWHLSFFHDLLLFIFTGGKGGFTFIYFLNEIHPSLLLPYILNGTIKYVKSTLHTRYI